jgi:hypothetical protein
VGKLPAVTGAKGATATIILGATHSHCRTSSPAGWLLIQHRHGGLADVAAYASIELSCCWASQSNKRACRRRTGRKQRPASRFGRPGQHGGSRQHSFRVTDV